jgi:hypothetical protein
MRMTAGSASGLDLDAVVTWVERAADPGLDRIVTLARRSRRHRLARYGPPTPPLALPELDDLRLPLLRPDEAPLPRRPPPQRWTSYYRPNGTSYYRPDGSLIEGDIVSIARQRATEPAHLRALRRVGWWWCFRAGTRIDVHTDFMDMDLGTGDGVVALVWETMVFFSRPRHDRTAGPWWWRYGSAGAAAGGHRRIAALLAAAGRARRAAR